MSEEELVCKHGFIGGCGECVDEKEISDYKAKWTPEYRKQRTDDEKYHAVRRAKAELMSIGYGSSGLDDMENERLYENVMELVTVFSKQRHSGLSAISVLYMFNKIVNDQPLTK